MTNTDPAASPAKDNWGDLVDEFDDAPDDTTVDDPGPEQDETPEPRLYYGSTDEFVREFLITAYRRQVGGGSKLSWRADWWNFPEAVARLETLWRAWEHLRLEGPLGMSIWWKDHADHHMSVLLSDQGPFGYKSSENERGEDLPYERPDKALFPDERTTKPAT